MIRIPRSKLDVAIHAMMECAKSATNVSGHRIVFHVDERQMEYAICGALSIIAPNGGPATPSDVTYLSGGIGTDDFQSFPKEVKNAC